MCIMSLSGKVALVTGAAQGLGKAFSESLLKRGAKVCIADVKVQEGEATAMEFTQRYGADRVMFMECDVTKESDFKATFDTFKKQYGRFDVIVNNAGISDNTNWRRLIDINLKGVIEGTKLAMDAMSKENGGNGGLVVNIASLAGLVPVSVAPEYAASKYGVVGFTLSLAELADTKSLGVSFTCMCPAFVDTEMVKVLKESEADDTAKRFLEMEGIMPISQAAEAFEKLLDTPDNNGVIITASLKKGIHVKRHFESKM